MPNSCQQAWDILAQGDMQGKGEGAVVSARSADVLLLWGLRQCPTSMRVYKLVSADSRAGTHLLLHTFDIFVLCPCAMLGLPMQTKLNARKLKPFQDVACSRLLLCKASNCMYASSMGRHVHRTIRASACT